MHSHYNITILVALYKAGQFLETKLQSLRQQTHFDKSLILLLNCQDLDHESKIYADFIHHNHNVIAIHYDRFTSLYKTWNDGIRTNNTIYLMNSNVDDCLAPTYVEECCDYLDNYLEIGVVSTNVLITDNPNQLWPNWTNIIGNMPISYPGSTAGPCPVWRRELHKKYGYFGNYLTLGDAKIWEKWHANGVKFGVINKDLALYYAHADSLERRCDLRTGRSYRDIDLANTEAELNI